MFQHPADIPIPFALAVHAIVHNQATAEHWETVDGVERDKALEDIGRIYEANGMQFTAAERDWWLRQFAVTDN